MNSSAVYLGEGVWEGLVSLTGGFIMIFLSLAPMLPHCVPG